MYLLWHRPFKHYYTRYIVVGGGLAGNRKKKSSIHDLSFLSKVTQANILKINMAKKSNIPFVPLVYIPVSDEVGMMILKATQYSFSTLK